MLTPEREQEIDQMLSAPSDGYSAGEWCEIANELRAEIDRLRAELAVARDDRDTLANRP